MKQYRPTTWHEIALIKIKQLPPPAASHRLGMAHYSLLPFLNPSGQPRPPRIVSEAWLRLSERFAFVARIVLKNSVHHLQVEAEVYDIKTRATLSLEADNDLFCSVYQMIRQQHVFAQGRVYRRSEGRN